MICAAAVFRDWSSAALARAKERSQVQDVRALRDQPAFAFTNGRVATELAVRETRTRYARQGRGEFNNCVDVAPVFAQPCADSSCNNPAFVVYVAQEMKVARGFPGSSCRPLGQRLRELAAETCGNGASVCAYHHTHAAICFGGACEGDEDLSIAKAGCEKLVAPNSPVCDRHAILLLGSITTKLEQDVGAAGNVIVLGAAMAAIAAAWRLWSKFCPSAPAMV
jgi:hypothetical protein